MPIDMGAQSEQVRWNLSLTGHDDTGHDYAGHNYTGLNCILPLADLGLKPVLKPAMSMHVSTHVPLRPDLPRAPIPLAPPRRVGARLRWPARTF